MIDRLVDPNPKGPRRDSDKDSRRDSHRDQRAPGRDEWRDPPRDVRDPPRDSRDWRDPPPRSSGRRPPPPPSRRRRGGGLIWNIFWGLFALGFAGSIVFALVAFVYVVRVTDDLPAIEDLASYEPPVMSRVQAGDGRLIAEYARESRVFVPIETIPPQVINAFLSAEDKNFYHHVGIEPVGMLRAQIRNVANMIRGVNAPLQGGSTITQQVAKVFKLDSSQTVERKVREIALTFRLEEALTKDQILELYLNEIYLGNRAYGVAAAGLLYFGKPLDELTLSEIAYLAAVPRAPNNYHPVHDKDRAIERRNWVLDRMVANGVLDAAEAEIAKRDDLVVSDRLTGSTYQAAEYFVEEVRRFAFDTYGDEQLYDGGLSIRTTLDSRLQIAARDALRKGLETYDRRHGYRGPIATIEVGEGWVDRLIALPSENIDLSATWSKAVVLAAGDTEARIGFLDGSEGVIPLSELTWARRVGEGGLGPSITAASGALNVGEVVYVAPLGPDDQGNARDGQFSLRQIPAINGAIVAIDPHTGRVLAMVGGYSYRLSQFNRATQARRQPGSSFKPFVYAAALDHGYTPVSMILDAPYVSTAGEDGSFYKPTNYSGNWLGQTTLRRGIELSRNMMTVRLANAMGLEHMSEYGERFGVYDDLQPYEAMSLGAGETTLWRMVTGYAEFVNGGMSVTPTIIDRVQDRNGGTIYRHDERVCTNCQVDPETQDWATAPTPQLTDPRERVISDITAYQIVSILQGVVDRGTAASSVGQLDWPLGGKTGTSNDEKDTWFIGFSPDLVAGVYVGFDTPRPLGSGETGGVVAAPIFRDFMRVALEGAPKTPFRTPSGVKLVPVNSETGALARLGDPNVIWEAFRPGTEPTRFDSGGSSPATGFSTGSNRPSGGLSIAGPNDATRGPSTIVLPEQGGAPPAQGGSLGGATVTGSETTGGATPPTTPPAGNPFSQNENPLEGGAPAAGAQAGTQPEGTEQPPAAGGGLGALLDQLETAGGAAGSTTAQPPAPQGEQRRGSSGLY